MNTTVSNIVAEAGEQALRLFTKHSNARLLWRNYAYAQAIARCAEELCQVSELPTESREVVQIAAWFLPVGYGFDYENYLRHSLDQAQRFLALRDYPEAGQQLVLKCLKTAGAGNKPFTPEEKVLTDAVNIATWIDAFEERNPLMQLEAELMQQHSFTKAEWATLQLQRLLEVQLHTPYAKAKYEPLLAQNISRQQRVLEKARRKENAAAPVAVEELRPFQQLDDTPIRAVQTFFRANYRNHINLSAIADNKANIMISVNSILISVLISILSYRNLADTNPQVVLPVVIFLVSGLASLIFAVLSARPKVTSLNTPEMSRAQKQRNIVFFGNFVQLDSDEYEAALDAVFRDSELLYGNLARDLYHLGKVLDKKYRYLTVSYNIFMIGFIATVTTFIILLFL